MRDPRLAGFVRDGSQDAAAPSGRLALLADELSGPERRCPGATDDELIGLLRAWAAIESWASGAKLGVIRELIRREGVPVTGGCHGDLPDGWSQSLRYELANALACSTQSAETTAWLAWEQQARLPGVGALLTDGTLTPAKARAITETFKYLMDADAARAEALIQDQLGGKTYTQVLRLAEQAALIVDPELAERRREQAQRKDARVTFFRELSGTAGLSGRDLPPDEALVAMASVHARAAQYAESGAFGDARMDVLRAYAYLDLLNGVAAEARIACAEAQDEAAEAAEDLAWAEARAADRAAAGARAGREAGAEAPTTPSAGSTDAGRTDTPDNRDGDGDAQARLHDCPCGECDGGCLSGDDVRGLGDSEHDDDGPDGGSDPDAGGGDGGGGDGGGGDGGYGGDGGPGSGDPGPRPNGPPTGRARPPRPADLIVPLATLLGLAGRPGEIQGFGLLDPALARELAAAAVASPRTEVCVTVTSPEGYAIGHGCARPDRARQGTREPGASPAGLPARLNLTIPAIALSALSGLASATGPWAFSPRDDPGPPDGYGAWTLTLPGGWRFAVHLEPVPTIECDHRYETNGYQPKRQAPPPSPGPRWHVHVPALLAPRPRIRLRACGAF